MLNEKKDNRLLAGSERHQIMYTWVSSRTWTIRVERQAEPPMLVKEGQLRRAAGTDPNSFQGFPLEADEEQTTADSPQNQ